MRRIIHKAVVAFRAPQVSLRSAVGVLIVAGVVAGLAFMRASRLTVGGQTLRISAALAPQFGFSKERMQSFTSHAGGSSFSLTHKVQVGWVGLQFSRSWTRREVLAGVTNVTAFGDTPVYPSHR